MKNRETVERSACFARSCLTDFIQTEGRRTIESAIHLIIGWFILPIWVGAGFADYLMHRRTHIEASSGVRESAIHLLMVTEVGVPLAAAVFLKVDASVILFFVLCFMAHEITGNIDIRYAESHGRDVSPTEDQIHSVLEIIPLTAALLILLPHFGQVLALFRLGPERADFSIALKEPPELWKVIVTCGALIVFIFIPYGEELIRCLRHDRPPPTSRIGPEPKRLSEGVS